MEHKSMNERIRQLALEAGAGEWGDSVVPAMMNIEKFAKLIVRECIDKIETHRIPVGNSAAGEMACEWTYSALHEIRDDIKQSFGVE